MYRDRFTALPEPPPPPPGPPPRTYVEGHVPGLVELVTMALALIVLAGALLSCGWP